VSRARATTPLLEVSGLTHRFGDVVAVDGVGLSIGSGEIVGLVGRNGAGKTTTMRAIMGILLPERGVVTWRGHAIGPDDRLRFGYMPEERGLYPEMKVLEQVTYFAELHGLRSADARKSATAWLERLGVVGRDDDKLTSLSHGNQQRVQLAVALAHEPECLVLDEPFAGLDPAGVNDLSQTLRAVADRSTAVLFSSHQLDLVERICDRVVILETGHVIASGTLSELRARFPRRLRVSVKGQVSWAATIKGARVLEERSDGVLFLLEPGADPQAILRAAQAIGPVDHFGLEDESLEEMYLDLVKR
jgi:ABC-2 type transport system ATP-binding protein